MFEGFRVWGSGLGSVSEREEATKMPDLDFWISPEWLSATPCRSLEGAGFPVGGVWRVDPKAAALWLAAAAGN